MESSPENFESLRTLLRVKRYEQPPPRYFNDFSSRIISRIEAEQRAANRWWMRFGLDLRPALGLGAAVSACLFVFFGFGFSSETEAGMSVGGMAGSTASVIAQPTSSPDAFAAADTQGLAGSSTNIVNPAGSMMLDMWRARVTPASFHH